jgi:hypothetical protein
MRPAKKSAYDRLARGQVSGWCCQVGRKDEFEGFARIRDVGLNRTVAIVDDKDPAAAFDSEPKHHNEITFLECRGRGVVWQAALLQGNLQTAGRMTRIHAAEVRDFRAGFRAVSARGCPGTLSILNPTAA